MSSPEITVVLSDQAQEDYEDILSETLTTWGERQHDQYAALLDDALRTLSAYPALGKRSRQLPALYRVLHVGSHLIVYRVTDTMLYVVALSQILVCRDSEASFPLPTEPLRGESVELFGRTAALLTPVDKLPFAQHVHQFDTG